MICIFAKKNILYPKLFKDLYELFSSMSGKVTVKPVLINFIKSCAYLGHIEGYDIKVLVQIYTRIFKEPSDCLKDIDSLIDLILLIAL